MSETEQTAGTLFGSGESPRGPLQRLGQSWRLVGTAISFALFGIGGLVMALLFFPLVNLAIRNPERREHFAQGSVHTVWWLYVRLMRALGVLEFRFEDADRLRKCRGSVVVANHPSLLDVVFLMSSMDRSRAVVKRGVWENRFMAGVVRATNYIPNLGDPERLIEDCADALRSGANIVIFPEGSRVAPGEFRVYQRGFAHAAIAAGAPVVVVAIEVEPATLRKGEPWYVIPRTRPHWTIRVADIINTKEYHGDRSRAHVRQLSSRVRETIESKLGQE